MFFCFDIRGIGLGSTQVELFMRSSEDNPEIQQGIPLPLVLDMKNLWMDNSTGLWYPAHNSYDPWDSDILNGHSWEQFSWIRRPTTNAYAKDFLVGERVVGAIGNGVCLAPASAQPPVSRMAAG